MGRRYRYNIGDNVAIFPHLIEPLRGTIIHRMGREDDVAYIIELDRGGYLQEHDGNLKVTHDNRYYVRTVVVAESALEGP